MYVRMYVCMYVCIMYVWNLLLTLSQTNYWTLSYPRVHLVRAPKRYTTTIIITVNQLHYSYILFIRKSDVTHY